LTRTDITAKWVVYSLLFIAAAIVQQLVLDNIKISGEVPFLLPVIVALVAAREGSVPGTIFAIVFGMVCEFGGYVPIGGIYVISFTVAALIVSLIARFWVSGGVFGGVVYAGIAFIVVDAFLGGYMMIFHSASFYAVASVGAREMFASIFAVFPLYPLVYLIHTKFTRS